MLIVVNKIKTEITNFINAFISAVPFFSCDDDHLPVRCRYTSQQTPVDPDDWSHPTIKDDSQLAEYPIKD
jgi:hypothetical protein